ncbi:hypothetical protein BF7_00085 [Pseudomonas phage Bf7]|uniref:Fe2OG dioxygenase domain-containing protein n=1 Tax=Pseudomonas phage Bf7 TaxID=1100790 RepID=H2ELV3_9CAUD|nr:hypothetical protein BF7_00085 [Pseudomonas phage Bf7]AEX65855.1 hypothetical protein BF7_00085 [Pseudomonas phage Bf7]
MLDPRLFVPTDDLLHADLIPHLEALRTMADGAARRGGVDFRDFHDMDSRFKAAADLIWRESDSVFSMPFLSPETCAALVRASSLFRYEKNASEEPDFQIPEVVLKHECLGLHASLAVLFDQVMLPVAELLYGIEPEVMRSIQLAQYRPTETGYGNWHVDLDSDFTVVVALSNEHAGGGTEVKAHGFSEAFEVPQLPTGSAMIFPGKLYLHRGMPVTEGVRNLLVFWSEVK